MTLARKELKHIRDEDLALSEMQQRIFDAKFIKKLDTVDKILKHIGLGISKSTYHREIAKILVMYSRVYEQDIL